MLKQLTMISVRQLFGGSQRGKKKRKLPPWLMMLLVGALLCASFYVFFEQFAKILYNAGLGWIYYALVGTVVFAVTLLTDVALVQGQLFESTHNDILLSMPIKTNDILISRLLSMLLYNYMFELCLLGPSVVAWIVNSGKVGSFLVCAIVLFFFWPLLPMALSIGIGYLLTRFTYKLKNKNLVKTILVFGFIAGYYYLTFTLESKIADIDSTASEMARMFGTIKITEWFGKGIMHSNVKYILYIIAIGLVAMAVMLFILNRSFIKIITSNQGVITNKVYKEKPVRERGIMHALWFREFKRLGAYFNYLINTLMPLVLMAAGIIFFIIKGKSLLNDLISDAEMMVGSAEFVSELAATMIVAISCVMMTTYIPSAASISLEGSSLDTLKSLPIRYETILDSKLLFHYSLMAPLQLIASILVIIFCKPEPIMCIGVVLLPQAFLILTDEIGLCYNLLYPKLAWTNEAVVVKRSASVTLSMFTAMIIGAIIVVVYFLLIDRMTLDMYTYMLILTGVLGLISVILYLVIRKFGVRRMGAIGGE